MRKIYSKKLNLGAGGGWHRDGWETLDHSESTFFKLRKQAWNLPYPDNTFDIVFTSHMIEHISHFKIEEVICEINRVMAPGGILRILTPDLRKIATAYVNNDVETMNLYIQEDGSGIKTTLGMGQGFMGFICSPGFDNQLFSSDYSCAINGYAHVYSYDYEMLSSLLMNYGFDMIRQCDIDESEITEHKFLRSGSYDKDKNHSLIVECHKRELVNFSNEKALLHSGPYNYKKLRPTPLGGRYFAFKIIGHMWNIRSFITHRFGHNPLADKIRSLIKY